ncbi:cytochrome P450 2J6-like [Glandiceps talaboti]
MSTVTNPTSHGYIWDLNIRTFIVAALTLLMCLMFLKPKNRSLPPGPWIWPILGNIPSFVGNRPYLVMRDLAAKYGNVVYLRLGTKEVVVLNGLKTMKEALNSDVFNGRPMRPSEFTTKGDGIVFAGAQQFKHRRRIVSRMLRDFGVGQASIEGKILEEVKWLIKEIEHKGDNPFNPRNDLTKSVSNVTCAIVFGKRFDYNDPVFQRIISSLHESMEAPLLISMVMFCPILIYLPIIRGRMCRAYESLKEGVFPAIATHKQTYHPDRTRDIIDMFIKDLRPVGEDKDQDLVQSTIDLFAAGTETSSTTILWGIVFLVRHPQIQQKVHMELDRVVGHERLPRMEDRAKLPYLEAVICETQRLSAIAPLSVPHETLRDTLFQGYFIPKGVIVLPNLWGVLHDPDIWTDPDIFRPERFLNEDGSFKTRDEFIPFGIGSRVCLGEQLAKAKLFLFLSSLFQRFQFQVSAEHGVPSDQPHQGVSLEPESYCIRTIKRYTRESNN